MIAAGAKEGSAEISEMATALKIRVRLQHPQVSVLKQQMPCCNLYLLFLCKVVKQERN